MSLCISPVLLTADKAEILQHCQQWRKARVQATAASCCRQLQVRTTQNLYVFQVYQSRFLGADLNLQRCTQRKKAKARYPVWVPGTTRPEKMDTGVFSENDLRPGSGSVLNFQARLENNFFGSKTLLWALSRSRILSQNVKASPAPSK